MEVVVWPLSDTSGPFTSYSIKLGKFFSLETASTSISAHEFSLLNSYCDLKVRINSLAAAAILAVSSDLLITVAHNYFATSSVDKDIVSPVIFFEPSGVRFDEKDSFVIHCSTYVSFPESDGDLDYEDFIGDLGKKVSMTTTTDDFEGLIREDRCTYGPVNIDQWILLPQRNVKLYKSKMHVNDKMESIVMMEVTIDHFSGSYHVFS